MINPTIIHDILPPPEWLSKKGQNCILSPDCDGFLCGLFMSFFFDWKIKGYYDGNALIIDKNVTPCECVFLDMEICRSNVRSVGQHLLYFNVDRPPQAQIEAEFSNCLSPNNIRRRDFKNDFNNKYPLATIHWLMAILPDCGEISEDGLTPLFYVDDTFKNLLNYPENCLDWLSFMDVKNSPLGRLFYSDRSISQVMTMMVDFFTLLNSIRGKPGADKLPLMAGVYANITDDGRFLAEDKEPTECFLEIIGNMTGWKYNSDKWTWDGCDGYVFEKDSIEPKLGKFQDLMEKHPLSWAIINSKGIKGLQYTLDNQNIFTPVKLQRDAFPFLLQTLVGNVAIFFRDVNFHILPPHIMGGNNSGAAAPKTPEIFLPERGILSSIAIIISEGLPRRACFAFYARCGGIIAGKYGTPS